MLSYFSFGCGQMYKDNYVKIEAEDPRKVMFQYFGNQWSMEYNEERFKETSMYRDKTELSLSTLGHKAYCDQQVIKFGRTVYRFEMSIPAAIEFCNTYQLNNGGKCDWFFDGEIIDIYHLEQDIMNAVDTLDGLIDGEDDELGRSLEFVKCVMQRLIRKAK